MRYTSKYSLWYLLSMLVILSARVYAAEIPAMPVQVAKAVSKDVPVTLKGSGHLEPFTAINVKSRINGKLEKVHIKDGQIVKEGDLLFEIDTVPYMLAVKKAEADLKYAEAGKQVSEEVAGISTKLYDKEVIAKEKMDQEVATAKEGQANVAAAQAALDIAKQNLDYCKITAPIDGMLGRKLINQGNLISAYTDVIIDLNDIKKFKVVFSLPSKELRNIKQYYKDFPLDVSVSNPELEGVKLEGKLLYVGNQVDKKTGMFELQGVIDNKDYNFWPGEFVNAVVTLTVRKDSVVIPARALINSTGGSKIVYVIDKDTAQPRPVKVGWTAGEEAIILEGIKKDEVVAVEGLFKLYPGAKVVITPEKKAE